MSGSGLFSLFVMPALSGHPAEGRRTLAGPPLKAGVTERNFKPDYH
jgi:hypothetical protein